MAVHIMDVETKKKVSTISEGCIVSFEWSPKENYIVTCTKQKQNNLKVWNVATGQQVAQFDYKGQANDGPKSI